jgi:acyl-CoA thioesterase
MRIDEAGNGFAVVSLEPSDGLRQIYGRVHGGVVAALADSSMGAAVYSTLSNGEAFATIDLDVRYTYPVSSETLRCRAEVVRRGRRVAFARYTVTTGQAKVIAYGSGTYAILGENRWVRESRE